MKNEAGPLFQREQESSDGRPERGCNARCHSGTDEIALLGVISEGTEGPTREAAPIQTTLGEAGSDDGADVNHWTLLADKETAGNREDNSQALDKHGAGAHDEGYVETVEVAFHLWNTASSRDGL